jgi:hypothetical protein
MSASGEGLDILALRSGNFLVVAPLGLFFLLNRFGLVTSNPV